MKYNFAEDIKILFLGTPEIAKTVLASLYEEGFDIVGVVTQEDKKVGRKGILTPSPVKKYALEKGIAVYTPHRIRLDYEFAKSIDFDVIVCIAYGQILPIEFLNLAKVGALNLHGSILPELRGASPIQTALLEGRESTGVTLMEMGAGLDDGLMYLKKLVPIEESDNSTSLFKKIGEASAKLICENLLSYANGKLVGEKQDEEKATFTHKFKAEDEYISLSKTRKEILGLIRALSEEPGAYLYWGDKKFKILKAHLIEGNPLEVGRLICSKKTIDLSCVDGLLRLDVVQMEGKKAMDAPSFLNGLHEEGEKKLH